MSERLKVALRAELPGSEVRLFKKMLSARYDVSLIWPWDAGSHTVSYDVAVCLGPVTSRPLAKKSVLVVLGMTRSHADLSWDVVVVSSRKAQENASRFDGADVRITDSFIPDVELGRRRNFTPFDSPVFIHTSEFGWEKRAGIVSSGCWGLFLGEGFQVDGAGEGEFRGIFDALEFNTWIRQGGVGVYPDWMEDGYDLQVRRHLALGGGVICRKDDAVLGEWADLVSRDGCRAEARAGGNREKYESEMISLIEGV